MNIADILILALIGAAIVLAVRRVRKHGTCSCGCDNCPSKCGKKR